MQFYIVWLADRHAEDKSPVNFSITAKSTVICPLTDHSCQNRTFGKIKCPEDRLEPVANELNGILDWIAELNEVATDNVEPLASVTGHALPMRDDVVTDVIVLTGCLPMCPRVRVAFLWFQRLLNNV